MRVFLAGSIDNGKASPWADAVANALSDLDVAFLNPRVDDWDTSLEPRMHEPKFAHQVNWELDRIDNSQFIFFYFEGGSVSPITLMELGYVIGMDPPSHIIVCCPDDFWRKGNVEVMCSRAGIDVFNTLSEAQTALRDAVESI